MKKVEAEIEKTDMISDSRDFDDIEMASGKLLL